MTFFPVTWAGRAGARFAHDWFRVREAHPGVWLIAEPPHVNTWLVVGSERAALLDTGLGVAPIRPVAEAIAGVPVVVVNTHAHFDHVGGNHEFEAILIHELGAPLLEHDVPGDVLAGYVAYVEQLEQALPDYLATDRRFLFALEPGDEPRPLPAAARSGGWRIPASRASGTLRDGDRIGLGDRELTVLHTPGHSPDHVALLLEHEGLLFAGDCVSTGAIYAQWPESDVGRFAASAARLAALATDVRAVYVHHFMRACAPPSLLVELAKGFEALLRGGVSFRANRDCAGQPVREAVFSRFSIYIPEEGRLDGGR